MRTDAPDTASNCLETKARQRFALATGLAAMWLLGLGVLSFTTANPITLNRDQIREADDVLTAVVDDPATGRVRVETAWKNVVRDEHLTLPNLATSKPSSGQRLLVPVRKSKTGWQVMPSKLPKEPPLVYPVSDESERQLRLLLK
ncbi:MAG: hypothetical protein ACKV2Q_12495 [Planctomycetaceae bacterium]